MDEKIKEYLPYIIAAVVVGIGIYFFKNGVGSSSSTSYSALTNGNSDTTNALIQAQAAANAHRLDAGVSGIQALLGYENARNALNAHVKEVQDQDYTAATIKYYDAFASVANNRTAANAAKHNSDNNLWGSVISAIGTYAIYAALL